jgi:hypothetical protein
MMLVAAGVFVVLSASASQAGMMGHNFTSLDAIDSAGHVVVTIQAPSSPVVVSSLDRIYLDSNRLWSVADYSNVSSHGGMATVKTGASSAGRLYCFDAVSKFCALSF